MFMYMNSLFFPSLAVCYEQDKSIQRPAFFLSIVSPPKLGGEVPSVSPVASRMGLVLVSLLTHYRCPPMSRCETWLDFSGTCCPPATSPLDLTVPL